MNRLVSRLKVDVIDRVVDHKLTGAVTRFLDQVAASKGFHVLQGLALTAVIATVYVGAQPLTALLWIFLFCCVINVSATIDDLTKNILFIALCLQYFLVHLIKLNFVDELIPGVTGGNLKSRMWVWGGVIIILAVPFFCGIKNLSRIVDVAIPPVLLSTFVGLSFWYWREWDSSPDWQGGGCRIKGLHRSVFEAPLIFTTFTVIYLRNLDVKSVAARRVAYALVVCSLIMSMVFAGTRSIAAAQIITYLACCAIFALNGPRGRSLALQLFGTLLLGVLLGVGLVNFVDCAANSLARIIDPSADVSALTRYDLYMKSLELISERPIFGYSIAFEKLASSPYSHTHNMYLSWALWGGVISLVSGIMFILANLWSNLGKMRQPKASILLLAVLGPWGVSQLFDSFLIWSGRLYLFTIYICLVQALLVRETEARQGQEALVSSG